MTLWYYSEMLLVHKNEQLQCESIHEFSLLAENMIILFVPRRRFSPVGICLCGKPELRHSEFVVCVCYSTHNVPRQ